MSALDFQECFQTVYKFQTGRRKLIIFSDIAYIVDVYGPKSRDDAYSIISPNVRYIEMLDMDETEKITICFPSFCLEWIDC